MDHFTLLQLSLQLFFLVNLWRKLDLKEGNKTQARAKTGRGGCS